MKFLHKKSASDPCTRTQRSLESQINAPNMTHSADQRSHNTETPYNLVPNDRKENISKAMSQEIDGSMVALLQHSDVEGGESNSPHDHPSPSPSSPVSRRLSVSMNLCTPSLSPRSSHSPTSKPPPKWLNSWERKSQRVSNTQMCNLASPSSSCSPLPPTVVTHTPMPSSTWSSLMPLSPSRSPSTCLPLPLPLAEGQCRSGPLSSSSSSTSSSLLAQSRINPHTYPLHAPPPDERIDMSCASANTSTGRYIYIIEIYLIYTLYI